MVDEFYMQLYRQCNTEIVILLKPMFLIMVFLSRYMTPSERLIRYYEEWLLRKKNIHAVERLIKHVLVNFKVHSSIYPAEKGLYVCWPPSQCEIQALDNHKAVKVKVLFPAGDSREYEVDEATTVESLMNDKIFVNDKHLKGLVEPQFYWLYSLEDDLDHFPMPISKEKKVLKLLHRAERAHE